ncbi:MAG: hypothetical protein ACEQSA_01140 [Weeksellaceae bacterium]
MLKKARDLKPGDYFQIGKFGAVYRVKPNGETELFCPHASSDFEATLILEPTDLVSVLSEAEVQAHAIHHTKQWATYSPNASDDGVPGEEVQTPEDSRVDAILTTIVVCGVIVGTLMATGHWPF